MPDDKRQIESDTLNLQEWQENWHSYGHEVGWGTNLDTMLIMDESLYKLICHQN